MNDRLTKIIINPGASIKNAMKRMSSGAEKILFVIDEAKTLIGVVSDGDIRRSIIKNGSLEGDIGECINRLPVFLIEKKYNNEDAKRLMLQNKIEVIPVLDSNRSIIDLLTWDTLFKDEKPVCNQFNCSVVIMAGGKGTRLHPYTKILPKPLIPYGEKPIVEIIMDTFNQYGIEDFYITLNHKGEIVKAYFDSIDIGYNLRFIMENDFLGTAGGLKCLPDDISNTFFVSNCDILVKADYHDIFKYHCENGNLLTIVGSLQHFIIPYGVIGFASDGVVNEITEKPEYDYTVNTGVYVMEKRILDFIPEDETIHATDLIKTLINEKERIGLYPVGEKSYIDIGQLEEYKKIILKDFSADNG